jgi:MATE family multidrug resistance protein
MPSVFELVHAPHEAHFTAMSLSELAADREKGLYELDQLASLKPMETGYAQILLVGSIILMCAKATHHYFFGMHRPKVVTIAAITGNIINVVGNYILIYGEEGLTALNLPGVPGIKPMGVYGAAIATVIGTCFELGIPLAVFLGPKLNRQVKSRAQWRPQWPAIKDLIRIGWPAAAQFGNELVCWAIFMSVFVGTFGAVHQSAGWIALGYMHLSFMPAVGFSVATTSLVGRYIGAGKPDIAVARARLSVRLSVIYMTVCGLVFFIFREPLVDLFVAAPDLNDPAKVEEAARIVSIGAGLMICAAVFQTFDAFGIVYTGALRGAGDTVWPGNMTILYSWLFIIGGGWAIIHWLPQWESIGPWVAASAYIIIFGVTMAVRFESGKWRSIKLLETAEERDAARIAPLGPAPPAAEGAATTRDIVEEVGEEFDTSRSR